MKPEFSEMQFVVGFLSEIKCTPFLGKNNTSHIFLPSQLKEKQCGYDIKLKNSKGIPLFYQFKTSNYTRSSKAPHYSSMNGPYYYFKTYKSTTIQDNQHTTLKKLSNQTKHVYYVCPRFYTNNEFDKYWTQSKIINKSSFIALNNLPDLPNTDHHHICYNTPNKGVFCSEPIQIEVKDSDAVSREIQDDLNNNNSVISFHDLQDMFADSSVSIKDFHIDTSY